jgi:hypothetical protein
MPPKISGMSRNVPSGNTATRSRSSVKQFDQKAVVAASKPAMKFKKAKAAPPAKKAMDIEDVIKAKPPKAVKA